MDLHVLRGDHGKQRLDDLQLDTLIGLGTIEAAVDGHNDAVDQQVSRIRRVLNGARQVAIGNELLQAVQSGDHDPGRAALAGQLEGQEVGLRIDDARCIVLGQRECGAGQLIALRDLAGAD